MRKDIHPNYHVIKATCSCGNSFETKSTYHQDELKLEICSNCHPFYTGKQNIVDTEGKVDSFNKRFAGFGGMSTQKQKETNS